MRWLRSAFFIWSQGQPGRHYFPNGPAFVRRQGRQMEMQRRKCEFGGVSPEEPPPEALAGGRRWEHPHCYSTRVAACQPSPGYCRGMCRARSQIMLPTKFLPSHSFNWGRVGGGCSGRGDDRFAHKRAARLESRSPSSSSSLSGSEPLPFILPDHLTLTEAKYKLGQHPRPCTACWAAEPAEAASSYGTALRRASKGT